MNANLDDPMNGDRCARNRGKLRNGNPGGDWSKAPRCGAKTRDGDPCRNACVHGRKRCRMHGGSTPRRVRVLLSSLTFDA